MYVSTVVVMALPHFISTVYASPLGLSSPIYAILQDFSTDGRNMCTLRHSDCVCRLYDRLF
jgi:hypothetical protein